MGNQLRILILEDVAEDVVRIDHALREAGLHFRSKSVDTKQQFLSELEQHPPDLILSDHGLPSFDGFTALAIAKETCPEVPFIFVTGSLGEQLTIETFKSGATDYVLKDHLGDLALAVKRALRKAKQRGRKQEADTALRGNEERFRLVMEGIKDYAIFMLDQKGQVTFWNAGAQELYSWSAGEVTGHDFSRFHTEEDLAQQKPASALKIAAAEGRFAEEGWRVCKDGKRFMASITLTAVRGVHGNLRGYMQVTRDITAQKRAEAELRRTEALKTLILESAPDAILLIDLEGKIREWNPAAQKIFGYTREQALGQSPINLLAPARVKEIYHDGLTYYLMTGAARLIEAPVELTLRRADGSEFCAEVSVSRNGGEQPSHYTVIARDITERKMAEAALRDSEERYRMLVEDVKDYAIYMLDPAGYITTWNTGAERVKGYTAAEALGKPFSIFFTPEDIARGLPTLLLKGAERDGQSLYSGLRVRKDGSRFWIQGIITALRDAEGKLRGFSKVAHDVTRQKELDEKIIELNENLEQLVAERTAQLEAANQELEAFCYSVSHDLRAPLLRISGFADIMRSEAAAKLDEKHLKYLQTIAAGAQQMSQLIDALLDFSRMSRTELRQVPVSLTSLFKEAQRELRRDIEGRNIKWRIGELPDTRGDPVMLRQVIINLLSNALKYTRPRPRAFIELAFKTEHGETVYFIRDNGVGFDMHYVDKLFGVFQRLHSERDFEGTGIGLANVRRILRRHGGRIWAESVLDQGATFYFTIPNPTEGASP